MINQAGAERSRARLSSAAALIAATTFSLAIFACADERAPMEQAEAGSPGESVASTQPAVLIPAPDLGGLAFTNQDAEEVGLDQLRGKPTLLAFIYTRCPMPTMCPATMLRFQEVQEALSEGERDGVQLVTMTFDPAHDTPAVLADYGALWGVDTSFWSLLTGSDEDIHAVAAAYGVWYEQTEDGNFDHTMYSMILFPDGAVHELLQGSTWDAEEVARKLVSMAAEPATAPR